MNARTYLKRIVVEEGYLDGLDLTFSPGLNALIGPRGSGKTSIIELIRYCLRIPILSRRRVQVLQAEAVLGGGRVTVFFDYRGKEIIVSRSSADNDDITKQSHQTQALILSQGEVEDVGVDPVSRLRLLDGFLPKHPSNVSEVSIASRILSATAETVSLRSSISDLQERIAPLDDLQSAFTEATEQQSALLPALASAKTQRSDLNALSKQSAILVVQREALERALHSLDVYATAIERLARDAPVMEPTASDTDTDILAPARRDLSVAADQIHGAIQHINAAMAQLTDTYHAIQHDYAVLESQMRDLRKHIDSIEAGAGAQARKVQQLQERLASLTALVSLLNATTERLNSALQQRGELLNQLEESRYNLYLSRRDVANDLNHNLAPRIRIAVERAGLLIGYSNALTNALRGSRLHLGQLIPLLVSSLSPRELLDAIDAGDVQAVRKASGITLDRARGLVEFLAKADLSELLTIPVEDRVQLELLDGPDYKPSEELSTGQRCTAVLPILLARQGIPILIDQPEDNLDNAFVVDTLVQSLILRRLHDQIIVATHNANIPVLAEADLVVSLGSDGRRGFVRSAAPLDSPASVRAITTVMEGGAEAFERRAAFYAEHSPHK
jgi:ABC-type lipoprotein export system ATPase subunit/predicted  nucleic acid-binding Zn-ribbon protein